MPITTDECKDILIEIGLSTKASNQRAKDLQSAIGRRNLIKREEPKEEEFEIGLKEVLTEG